MINRRRYDRPTIYLLIIIFITAFLLVFFKFSNPKSIDAVSTAEFDAGNIITNEVMGNYNSMTEAEIQAFLDSKNSCGQLSFQNGQMDGEFYVETVGSKTYKWHLDSNQKHVCLAEEKFSDNGVIGSGDTAAHLIYTYAQEYQINPQVILVLLQKEQGLLTDPYPNNYDYGWALGFGAYDFGTWDTKYAGFKEQLKAAFNFYHWFIYEYDEADSWWDTTYTEASPTFIKLGESNVAYNKNPSCGYSTLNIQNSATVSLYVYTPYQPNSIVTSGAKDETCGAYGNYNFYNLFNTYFPTTTTANIDDDNQTAQLDTSILDSEISYFVVSAANQSYILDVHGGNKTNIQLFKKHGGENQQFKFVYDANTGYYSIINIATNKFVGVQNSGTTNETNVQLLENNNTCATSWTIEKNSDDTYSILSACSGLALDIYGGNIKNETNIQIFTNWQTINQKWLIVQ